MKTHQTDFLVIGSGIAGLNFALNASKIGKVIVITKKTLQKSNTWYAQGGIAAVLSEIDNFEKHIKDTMKAGHYKNNRKAVEFLVKNAPKAIEKLLELGVKFDLKKNISKQISKNISNLNNLELGREGGHSENRIVHVGDLTGQAIEKILVKKLKEKAKKKENIEFYENCFAIDLILEKNLKCLGVEAILKNLNSSKDQQKEQNIIFLAEKTILCTGGSGQVFQTTTNPTIATGDGLAMAIRAGAKIQDLEHYQFHPTALDIKKENPLFLISEAVRGEGAILVNQKGERFMKNQHPQKDLAPRDIVTQAIIDQQSQGNKVFLKFKENQFTKKELQKRFPQIFKKLQEYKIDLSKDLIPVTPAAHYQCGGIKTNLKGETSIKNLYAFGEVACTGVHGANRLASNSLLEALVFSNEILKTFNKFKNSQNFSSKISTKSKINSQTKKIKETQKNKTTKEIEKYNIRIISENLQKHPHLKTQLRLKI